MEGNYVVHCGFNNKLETDLIKRYAKSWGYDYWWEGIKNDIFDAGDKIKNSKMAVIWNGNQFGGRQITNICNKRGIPKCYIEWGMLPQSETFFVDPLGFCGDSILAHDLSWVTEADINKMNKKRDALQKKYPIKNKEIKGYVLVPLQIENDTQVLHYSHYNNMEEFVYDVEQMFPNDNILVKLHPNSSNKNRKFKRAYVYDGDKTFLELAANCSRVVSITSTCLYEAGILGVPVVALGEHPLRIQRKEFHEKVLAGANALNINRANGDLGDVLRRFNIKPL